MLDLIGQAGMHPSVLYASFGTKTWRVVYGGVKAWGNVGCDTPSSAIQIGLRDSEKFWGSNYVVVMK